MTHDEMIRDKAWAMYCEETKDSPAAVDFPNQVPRAYWEELLIRAAIRVIAPAVERALRERDQAVEALRALLDGGTHHEVDTGIGPMTEETPAAVHARTTLASIEGTGHDD